MSAYRIIFALFILALCSAQAVGIFAQQAQGPQDADPFAINNPDDEVNPESVPSLLFTSWVHAEIKKARRLIGTAEAGKIVDKGGDDDPVKVKPPPEKRYISLNGIAYVKEGEWTIWINGQRVQPGALPKEVISLRVYKDYIELTWLDDYSNQTYPIRMRPHQRFNIDTRIFLPG